MWRYRNKEELLGQEIANNLEYKSDTLQTLQTEGSLKDTDKGLIHIPSLFLQEAPDENWPQEHRPQTDWNQKANEAWCQPMKLHLDANQSENCALITCPGGPSFTLLLKSLLKSCQGVWVFPPWVACSPCLVPYNKCCISPHKNLVWDLLYRTRVSGPKFGSIAMSLLTVTKCSVQFRCILLFFGVSLSLKTEHKQGSRVDFRLTNG